MIGVETDVSGDWDSRIDWPALARSAVHAAVAHSRHPGLCDSEVSVKFTSDDEVRALNAAWRGKDKATNVLSFPMADEAELASAQLLGDIVLAHGICAGEAAAKAYRDRNPCRASGGARHASSARLRPRNERRGRRGDGGDRAAGARVASASPIPISERGAILNLMEDDSRSGREDGRSFWSGLRALLFGDDSEATLRDEIEEAIESREGEVPRRRRPERRRAADAPQHPPFRREECRRRRRAARRHHRRARARSASRRWSLAFARPSTAACRSTRAASIR